jgi:hypothetical protein
MARKRHNGGPGFRWRLTPAGFVLLTALLVLIVLAIVAPSTPVYAGLALVIVIWAVALNSNSPTQTIGRSPRAARDFNQELREFDSRQRPRR